MKKFTIEGDLMPSGGADVCRGENLLAVYKEEIYNLIGESDIEVVFYESTKTGNKGKRLTGLTAKSNVIAELISIEFEDSIISIDDEAFLNCESLNTIKLPNKLQSIGYDAFGNCDSINDVYYTSDIASWLNISFGSGSANPLNNGANLYLNGELATDIVIPDSVTRIGYWAFDGCTSLTSVTIPDSVTCFG